jgi:hypothetical protein
LGGAACDVERCVVGVEGFGELEADAAVAACYDVDLLWSFVRNSIVVEISRLCGERTRPF